MEKVDIIIFFIIYVRTADHISFAVLQNTRLDAVFVIAPSENNKRSVQSRISLLDSKALVLLFTFIWLLLVAWFT